MTRLRAFWIVLALVGGLAFSWLVVLKLLAKLTGGRGTPCPASFGWLVDNPIRRRRVGSVLDLVGIRRGQAVLELGPGPGIYTVEAAHRLGAQGRLVAVDIQPRMIAWVEQKVRVAGLSNVETHVASAYQIPLPAASIDLAFAITVLPEIPDPERGLCELWRVLKPGGRLSVTEHFVDPDYPRRRTTIRWAEAAGFELEAQYGNWWTYTINFRKPGPYSAPI